MDYFEYSCLWTLPYAYYLLAYAIKTSLSAAVYGRLNRPTFRLWRNVVNRHKLLLYGFDRLCSQLYKFLRINLSRCHLMENRA